MGGRLSWGGGRLSRPASAILAVVSTAGLLIGSASVAAPKAAVSPAHQTARDLELERSFRNGIAWGKTAAQVDLDHCNERLAEADGIIFGPLSDDHERAKRYAQCLTDIRSAAYGNVAYLQAVISRCTSEFGR